MNVSLSASPVQAVAFDLDGLIFNTEDIFQLAIVDLVESRGIPVPDGLLRKMMGKRPQDNHLLMKQMLNLDEPFEVWQAELEERFFSFVDTHLNLMPGVLELLDSLEELDVPKAVATSSTRDYLENLLDRYGLSDRFEFFLTAEDVTNGKPHPEIYLTAASLHKVTPDQMVVFEDSENGTRAGVAAGAIVISVPHEHSREHDFSNASFVADTLCDPGVAAILTAHR